jgi:hypothetical protein
MKSNTQFYHKSLYPLSILQTAIEDYGRIAEISLSNEGDYFCCTFSGCAVAPERVVCEFHNYLIELLNSQGADSEL